MHRLINALLLPSLKPAPFAGGKKPSHGWDEIADFRPLIRVKLTVAERE